tara:strand:- start:243 stop:515 length:273 start_codon:yes stop_codon:yes gene_type:complete
MDLIRDYWEQIIFLGLLIWNISRSQSMLSEVTKDVAQLQSDVERLIKWTQKQQEDITRLRAETDVLNKQTAALWEFTNGLRDRFNGHNKH